MDGADGMDGIGVGQARSIPILILVMVALLLGGCGTSSGPLMSDLSLSSAVVAPTGRGDTQPIEVGYVLSRPAMVSAYLASDTGERMYLRRDEARPAAGEYALAFAGAYAPDPAGGERRVLPSGSYRLVVEARDAVGVQQQSVAQVQIRDADTTLPTVEKLAVFPAAISPDSDGIDDTARISYSIPKQATVTLYLVAESGKRYLLERKERTDPGQYIATWDGRVGDQLLPSGIYRLVVEARDAAGNVTSAGDSLRLNSSSVPDAHILSVNFEPQRILPGETVRVEVRVKNTGNTVLRSQGPDPGYRYGSLQSFGTVEGGRYPDQRGLWRVGVDWTTGPDPSTSLSPPGSKYPYRWGFGKDLQPGEDATVVGYLRVDQRYPRIWLYAGLIQEQVRYWDDEVGRTVIEIGD